MPDPTLHGNGENCPARALRREEDHWQTGSHPCNNCGGTGRIAYTAEQICRDTAKAYWSRIMTKALSKNMTIGEMAAEYGVTHRLLRFYEDQGFLRPERRGTTRIYRPEDQADLRMVIAATDLGLTLKEIAKSFKPGAMAITVPVELLANRSHSLAQDAVEKAHIAKHIGRTLMYQAVSEQVKIRRQP